MRRSLSIVAVLSAYLSAAAALPQSGLLPRAASDDQKQPKYSVVPLEPGDDQPGNEGGGDGHGTTDVTVVKTVVKTQEPTTQTIIKTADPRTVTKAIPTTISVIDISGDATATITVTHTETPERTVTVHQSSPATTSSPPSSSTSSEETTKTRTILPTGRVPSRNSTLSSIPVPKTPGTFSASLMTSTTISIITTASTTIGIITTSPSTFTTVTTTPSTFTTITTTPQTPSSSRTYDDGQWHTTYPSWNHTLTYRYKRS